MRVLIAEDDLASRKLMEKFLSKFAKCDLAVDGLEALDLFLQSHKEEEFYDLICIDIMMPKFDGIKVLRTIREIESKKEMAEDKRAKIIMITALNEKNIVMEAYKLGCDAYAWKPIDLKKFEEVMKNLGLLF